MNGWLIDKGQQIVVREALLFLKQTASDTLR